jgi:hypothetical protein
MDQISAPAGRVQSPREAQEGSAAPNQQKQQKQHQTPDALDALDTRMGEPQTDRDASNTLDLGPSSAPPSPSTRPGSLATTAVSSPVRPRDLRADSGTRDHDSSTMGLLVVLAKLAAFTVCQRRGNSYCYCSVGC